MVQSKRAQPSLSRVEKSLDLLHHRLDDSAAAEQRWRALELLTDTVTGLAYLVLGTAVSTLAAGSTHLTWLTAFTTLLPAGLMVWLGARLLKAPVAVKGHFLDHPEQMQFFLDIFDDKNKGSLKAKYSAWRARPEVRNSPPLKHVEGLLVALQVNYAVLAAGLASFFILDLTIVFLVFKGLVGNTWAIFAMTGLMGAYGLFLWGLIVFLKRRPMKTHIHQAPKP